GRSTLTLFSVMGPTLPPSVIRLVILEIRTEGSLTTKTTSLWLLGTLIPGYAGVNSRRYCRAHFKCSGLDDRTLMTTRQSSGEVFLGIVAHAETKRTPRIAMLLT